MKRTWQWRRLILSLLWTILWLELPQPAPAQQPTLEDERPRVHPRDIVVFGRDVVVQKGEVSRHLVVVGGNAIIDGTVEGNMVAIFGSVKVTGRLERGLIVVLGSANLAPTAEVEGETFVVGGKLNLDPGARIGGNRSEIVLGNFLPDLQWVADWFTQGFLRARPLPPRLDWVWIAVSIYLLICLLTAALFARPVQACVNALEAQPAGSFFVGILSLILFGPLVFLLIVSVAGILVVPFLFLSFAAALFFGNLVVYRSTGLQIGRQLNLAGLQQPAISLLIGAVIFILLYMIPFLGFVVLGTATVWGLGGVVMAIFSVFRREREPAALLTPPPAAFAGSSPTPTEAAPPPTLSVPDSITLTRVGFWRRLWATMLDFVLLGLLIPITGPLFVLIWTAYYVAMWTWKGTTIGGIVAGIKIVRLDGQPMNFAVALVRSLSSFFSAVVLFIGFFWAGWDKDRQAWHDKIAGTAVVKVPKGMALI